MNSLDLGTKAKAYAHGTTGTEPGTLTPGSWVGHSARGVCTLVTRLCQFTDIEALQVGAWACSPFLSQGRWKPSQIPERAGLMLRYTSSHRHSAGLGLKHEAVSVEIFRSQNK